MAEDKNKESGNEFIALSEAAKKTGYTPEYLNYLSRKGKFHAQKIGRNWYTTQRWVREFLGLPEQEKKIISVRLETRKKEKAEKEKTISESKPKINSRKWGSLQENFFASEKEIFIREEMQEKDRGGKVWKSTGIFSLALISVFAAFVSAQTIKILKNKNQNVPLEIIMPEEGIVAGEETTKIGGAIVSTALASENYQIKEIKFGGDVALLARSYENDALEISDVRSEVITTKKQEETKLLIYWKTNKLAVSRLEYSKMSGSNPKTVKEENYGYDHSIILSALEPGTAYVYTITSRDRWGNEITSDRYSAYTGSKTVSVFDLIVNSMKEVFGWAIKK